METIDGLPPEARFLLRTLAAGLSLGEAAELVGLDGDEAAKRLRGAAARAGTPAPGAAAGPAALLDALRPLIERAAEPPGRSPATPCLAHDVADSLARRRLEGPLLLAAAEHAADCPACLASILRLRTQKQDLRDTLPPGRPRRRHAFAVVVLLAALLALLVLLCG